MSGGAGRAGGGAGPLRRGAPRFGAVVVSCEHGGNRVPARWQALFAGADGVLQSHRGWDPGALAVARLLAKALAAPLIFAQTSRLLIELNRSPGHPQLFSEFTRGLPAAEREALVAAHYAPYRAQVQAAIRAGRRRGAVLHLSSHSFTPVLGGEVRDADVGLLYDPGRPLERAFAGALAAALRGVCALRVRRNYPYQGKSDGLTTSLRREFGPRAYAGIELEMNQALDPKVYGRALLAALRTVL